MQDRPAQPASDEARGDDPFSVTVLGSSGTYAGPGGACSGFLLRSGATNVLMDAGPGTLANLQRWIDPTELDAIVVSHCHPDHWMELPVLRNALCYVLHTTGVPLYLTAETLAMVGHVVTHSIEPTFVPTVIDESSRFDVGTLQFSCSRTDHPVETLAFRVESQGRSLGYTADTGPGWSISDLGDPLDLVICEATFLDGSPETSPVHLSALQAGTLAREAGARRLVLTHVLPTGSADAAVAEAEAAYGAGVDAALPNERFDI